MISGNSAIRLWPLTILLLAACACGPPQTPAGKVQHDSTKEVWYGQSLSELAAIDRQAQESFRKGEANAAAALIEKGEPLSQRLLSVPRPTLAAAEAASDLDQLYGEMLLSNHNYGWARLLFQKNLARWKNWKPQTPETTRHLKLAESEIAECDRHIVQ